MTELIQLIAEIKAIHQNPKIAIRGVQASISSLLIIENIDLKHSSNAEMSLEAIGIKRFKIFGV